ncbi:hypothetical protein BDZ94DRAFT_983109 [Collybia nuda]|uniref:PEP5/VPS11 N-terminal domain-containing protein n=1 Tax=Collybia nuda TaxID=64659 RepID=A0A9P6CGD9_9AGAR|nr:hypothetical protein BDZ94DRAFT_983109 [Collybia nuda]
MQATPEISTVASSSIRVLVADIHGSVHILNEDFESAMSWIANTGGRVTHIVEHKGILVTLGVREKSRFTQVHSLMQIYEEGAVRLPLLNIWDLSSRDAKSGAPTLIQSTKFQPSNRPHPVRPTP